MKVNCKTLLAAFAVAAIAPLAAAQSNCCFANGGVGCDDPTCQAAVCAIDSFCCAVAWDSVCAGEAAGLCAVCGGGGNPACGAGSSNDCCVASPNGTPGCSDETCCNNVCAVDSFCCAVAWDSICASEAVGICGCVVQCPPASNSCYQTGGPGCSDPACCALVCGADSFCCAVAWDSICVSEAFSFCGIPNCPFDCVGTPEPEDCGADTDGGCNVPVIGTSSCCFANGGIGCDDPTCQDAVCAVDSFCCAVAWDSICASEALTFCPDICQLGTPGFANIDCNETICGTAWASGGTRDTDWYIFTVTDEPGTLVSVSIVNQLPMVIGVVNSTDCSTASFLNPFAVSDFCSTAKFTFCFAPGTYWLFAAPNTFDGFPCDSGANNYALTATCEGTCTPLGCGSAGHDCYHAGGPYCDDVSCCQLVCSIDSFCCAIQWDSICVNEAFQFCGVPNCPFDCTGFPEDEACGDDTDGGCNVPVGGTSNCCVANGGVGCDDPTCQAAVCAVDSFCCAVAWDSICASEALTFCPDICTLGTPSFGSIRCGQTICGTAWASGGTRDTDWYILNLPIDRSITVSATTQLPLVIGIVNSTDCSTASFLDPFAVLDFCGTGSFTVDLPAGEHWVFAAPNTFDGFPCGSGGNNYSLTVDCPSIPEGDANNDGCINGADIATILGDWDPDGSLGFGYTSADVNKDGVVNGGDITVVLGNWLLGCP